MEDPNVNVMVEAKKEYTAQLCNIMCPFMIETFELMYEESEKLSGGKKVLLQFQRLLKEVPNWNNHMIAEHNNKMTNSCSWFSDLLAAVFVSNVKILSSVRLHAQNKKISIKLPTNDRFIHACYINAAKDIYKDPYVFNDTNDRDEILTPRFVAVIMTTVQEMIPVQEILKTYISQKEDVEQVDVESVMGEEDMDTEDPEIEDPEPPTQEPEPPQDLPTEPQTEPPEEEDKNIPLTGAAAAASAKEEDDVLFGDAPEEQKPTV